MLAGRSSRVTLDGVMGGKSTASGTAVSSDGSITFTGSINTNGGGFAYMTMLGGQTMDLSSQTGIMVSMDSMDMQSYGMAPIAFNFELEGSGRCTLSAAFAVPTTAVAGPTKAWIPLSHFEPKGSHWEYSSRSTGVPASCASSTTSLASISRFAIGNYYQNGPFKLVLHGVEARAGPSPAPSELTAVAPRDGLLASAVDRARSLLGKVGAGVGEAQMAGMAAAVLDAAAAQAGDATLLAIAAAVSPASAAQRASTLKSAFEVRLSGREPVVPAATSPAASAASTSAPPPSPPPPRSGVLPAAATVAIACGVGGSLLLLIAFFARRWPLRGRHARTGNGGRLVPDSSAVPPSGKAEGSNASTAAEGYDISRVPVTPSSTTLEACGAA